MIFYGIVSPTGNIYKPFYKSESLEDCKEVKGTHYEHAILKYKGHRRFANGRTVLVIKEIADLAPQR